MTEQQSRLLKVIKRYVDEHGYSPSYREMARCVGLHSTSGIVRLINALEAQGHIRRTEGGSRNIELVNPLEHVSTADLKAEIERRNIA